MEWEIVIGLETHAQLSTKSKIFSASSTAFGAEANTQASAIDMALPGTLPVFNGAAADKAIRFALAVDATITPYSVFARKNYFYPDLPKNYQTSQFDLPVVQGGKIHFFVGETEHTVNLTRAHLEEDAGKSLHENFTGPHGESSTGIDLNRAGTPLLEIVSEPEMRSAAEAVAYARALHSLVVWLGICDGNMQEGSFRCDANVSVRPKGQAELGTRCELKNINSFRFLERAINYEARRQIELIEDGGKVIQETRLYDADLDETRSMRTKEDANDYRYFSDPDQAPLYIGPDWIARVKADMPELPAQKRARFESELGLGAYDANQLTVSREIATFFENTVAALNNQHAKLAANWIITDLNAVLNREELDITQSKIQPQQLAKLIARIADNTISNKMAREVFAAMWDGEQNADADLIIEKRGLKQISDTGAIEAMVDEVIAANPAIVEQYRAGRDKAFNSLVGQVMKAARGKANPQQVTDMLKAKLD
ncbi:Asp-tRNA(Asn)/Glu-tRNA(Gln) amidotransferase subunit GatB [Paenalcaligenes hominis]|uniref:Asp-tRNA(Asn)/Glu-tRNA(Gln) amidotransferase subunit GatB n=1 Tax=Paenalcaligenes hominis TaxID=643674 RepID=UPI003525E76E